MSSQSPVLAVSLLSGGLDSTLAVRVLQEQGVAVVGVNFAGAYCPLPLEGESNAARAARQLGVELVTLPIDAGFIAMVKRPKHGRGRNMNPCIDCHALMIRRAWELGRARGAALVATGEVLGQRPMSQNRQSLEVVARDSGTSGFLLRPLSAKLLEPTVPEQQGLVDRSRLLDIEGRGRTRQMALAAQWGITEYPNPAGGCLLTEAVYSRRLAAAFARGEDSMEVIELLGIGRHFRLASGGRVVVGRNRLENEALLLRRPPGSCVVDGTALPGPLALLIPDRAGDRAVAARLVARFSDRRASGAVTVVVDGAPLTVAPPGAGDLEGVTPE